MDRSLLSALAIVATGFATAANAETITATVTAYNTVEAQTDDTPCIAASGADICGRRDVAACPSHIQFGTWVEIKGKRYECLDRTASKHDGRFDLSFGTDIQAALNWGIPRLEVTILGDS